MRPLALLVALASLLSIGSARADEPTLYLVADLDDDDGNGIADAEQDRGIPLDELRRLPPLPPGGVVSIEGPARLVRAQRALGSPQPASALRGALLQGTAPGEAWLVVRARGRETRRAVRVLELGFVDGTGATLDPARDGARPSTRIPHDPRRDRDDVGVRLGGGEVTGLTLSSVDAAGEVHDRVPARRWTRLVTSARDRAAPSPHPLLRVALGHRLRLEAEAPDGHRLTQDLSIGRPPTEDGPLARRRARLRFVGLRVEAGGAPPAGANDGAFVRAMAEELRVANEVWAPCLIDFGDPGSADVQLIDPPPGALVRFGAGEGMSARGGSPLRVEVAGHRVELEPARGASPEANARRLAETLEAVGLRAAVHVVPAGPGMAGPSAEVLVRDTEGRLVDVQVGGGDARQPVEVTRLDPIAGLEVYPPLEAGLGTSEERLLAAAADDGDDATIEVIVVPRFASGDRAGQAFLPSDRSGVDDVVMLDRLGLALRERAFTLSHELGHVLLDRAHHPEDFGPTRPEALMGSLGPNAASGGPRRLSREECARARGRGDLLSPSDASAGREGR